MSKYTTEVRYICESLAGLSQSTGADDVDRVIALAAPKIFAAYPIFDESYRSILNQKILKHYYTREIAFETYGLWRLKLNTKMPEIMVMANQMYKSQILEFDPFEDHQLEIRRLTGDEAEGSETETRTQDTDRTRSEDETVNSTANQDTTTTRKGGATTNVHTTTTDSANTTSEAQGNDETVTHDINLHSDTPQGKITNGTQIPTFTEYVSDASSNEGDNTLSTFRETIGRSDSTASSDSDTSSSSSENGTENVYDTKDEQRKVAETYKDAVEGSSSRQTTETKNGTYFETQKGHTGGMSFSELLLKYRDTFVDIDMMVIDQLEDLFMQLW